ncbi:MAG: polyprenyl synthetase family protein, partial [Chloroflexi bacterium]|nr:polyprenyl synthetase family protein [Chloroflexota bacterium]
MPDAMALVERQRAAVEAEMRALLEGRTLPLYRMLRYHLGWIDENGAPFEARSGGKRLRPALCLLTCAAVGGDPERAMPAAAALELLHNFTLIHDDIEDD